MNSLTVGKKIILGFTLLLLIAIALGAMAVIQMGSVEKGANRLAKAYVPEVEVASGLQNNFMQLMYAMRGYGYTGEERFLKIAREWQAKVLTSLDECKTLGNEQDLKVLKENEPKARKMTEEYISLSEQTVEANKAMDSILTAMNANAATFVKSLNTFLSAQEGRLNAAINASNEDLDVKKREIEDRVLKMKLGNNIVDIGNDIRIANFRSQATRNPKAMEAGIAKLDNIMAELAQLRPITRVEADIQVLNAIEESAKNYVKSMQDFLAAWLTNETLSGKRRNLGLELLKITEETAHVAMDGTTEIANDANADLSAASVLMQVGLTVATLLGIFLAWSITRSIIKPLTAAIETLSNGAEQTSSASAQVSSASQSLAEGSSEQASSLEETSSSLEEMASMTKRNAENANSANTLATQTRQAADSGVAEMDAMSKAMEAIKTSSNDISKIIKTIDEIAFQTNILALNAAVEAARAGEAGAGFAVVADEVRNLAQRSAIAARETAEKIEDAVSKSEQGVGISARVSESLHDIVQKAREVDQLISQIATASNEQNQGIQQINEAVTQLDQVTQSNAANAEETASASEELSAQAEELKAVVVELTRMVGGTTQSSAAPRSSHAASPSKSHYLKSTPVSSGASSKAKPALTGGGNKSKKLPAHLEEDFKDF